MGGKFVNKYLLSGPDFLNTLVGVILRFRRKEIVISADIKNFFNQIELDPRDASVMRYAVANFVLRLHAEKIRNLFPENVYEAILSSLCR